MSYLVGNLDCWFSYAVVQLCFVFQKKNVKPEIQSLFFFYFLNKSVKGVKVGVNCENNQIHPKAEWNVSHYLKKTQNHNRMIKGTEYSLCHGVT